MKEVHHPNISKFKEKLAKGEEVKVLDFLLDKFYFVPRFATRLPYDRVL